MGRFLRRGLVAILIVIVLVVAAIAAFVALGGAALTWVAQFL
jgi:hypothetical protein